MHDATQSVKNAPPNRTTFEHLTGHADLEKGKEKERREGKPSFETSPPINIPQPSLHEGPPLSGRVTSDSPRGENPSSLKPTSSHPQSHYKIFTAVDSASPTLG